MLASPHRLLRPWGADEDKVYESPSDDYADAWAALRETGDVPADVDLEDYVGADSCVVVRQELTDEDILKSVRAEDSASSGDEEAAAQVEPAPTTSEVMEAFNTIRHIIGINEDDGAMALLIECKSRVTPMLAAKRKHAKIIDFWH
ncbi:hypothetical protein HPB48_016663 [Haemaphysalis longicornis]|uniref:Uncharacterized protein n=1 Tax=Haemaphysalis longicornis TaxID=44386 RepID=A0A9J6GBP9_HAELO|nr:hypothetical protein HPB48_016663 [Haemaphysalis longicornis]